MSAGLVLRQLRRRSGDSQRAFAPRHGMALRTLQAAESGARAVSWDVVERVVAAAGLVLVVDEPLALTALQRAHLRLSLTERLWRSFSGASTPVHRHHPRRGSRPDGWVRLVQMAVEGDLLLRGEQALRVWLPVSGSPAPPTWSSTSVVPRHGRVPTAALSAGVELAQELPADAVPVPLAEPWPVVHVPNPAALALDPAVAGVRRELLTVARTLDAEAPLDDGDRRAPAHRHPDHAAEHTQVWHDRRLKRFPMPPGHDTRSWRLDDDASLRAWLRHHGLPA